MIHRLGPFLPSNPLDVNGLDIFGLQLGNVRHYAEATFLRVPQQQVDVIIPVTNFVKNLNTCVYLKGLEKVWSEYIFPNATSPNVRTLSMLVINFSGHM